MDVLSQAVTAMTTGRPRSYEIECHAPWGRRYAPVPEAGVHVVLEGGAILVREGADPIALRVGDVLLLPSGIGHGLASAADVPLLELEHRPSPEPVETVVIGPDQPAAASPPTRMLCGTYLNDSLRRHPVLRSLPPVVHVPAQLGDHTELSTVVTLLAAELKRRQPGSQIAIAALLDLLLVTTLRASCQQDPDRGWAALSADSPIAGALEHIHAHPQHPWTVAGLATAVGLSRAVFARRFTETIGLSPLAYLTWWRMALAARLLQDSDRVLADIARAVGYSSPYAFAHAFKREHGISPGRYRSAEPPSPVPNSVTISSRKTAPAARS